LTLRAAWTSLALLQARLANLPHVFCRRLVETSYEAMLVCTKQVKPGATQGDIGRAIQSVAHREHFSVLREYCGHSIGQVIDGPVETHGAVTPEGDEVLTTWPGGTGTYAPV